MFVFLNTAVTMLINNMFAVIIQINHIMNAVFANIMFKIKVNIN